MKRRSQPKQRRAPAPYTKQKKKPYRYSEKLEAWRKRVKEGRG